MNEFANLYFDPNAYPQKVKIQKDKPKVDLNHIEKVVYPQPYENISPRYFKEDFAIKKDDGVKHKGNGGGFDFNKLLPLLTAGGNLNNILPQLLTGLGVNGDILSLINNFKPIKKIESKVVEDFEKDTISKYKKVEK